MLNKYNNPWSKKDLQRLQKYYQLKTLKELSEIFKRPISKVCRKAREIGLKKDRKLHSQNISKSLKVAYLEGRRDCRGNKHPNWKNGITQRKDGYYSIYLPSHPNARNKRFLLHRYLLELKIGRYLTDKEIVHHIDGDCRNNDVTNLTTMTQSEHIKLHKKWHQQVQEGRIIEKKPKSITKS